jgi:5-methylcytosine-specific restriction protein A
MMFLDDHPFCVRCGVFAQVVDHVVPHRGDMGLFWDETNWAPMCKRCHDRKTASEDGRFDGSS